MSDKGLWNKELTAARFRFLAGLPIFVIMAVGIPLTYEYMLDILRKAPVPVQFAQQAEQLTNYSYYIWSQWYGKNLMQFGSILAIIFGAGLISSEVSQKTIYFLLTKPLSRRAVYGIKYIINLVSFEAVLLISSLLLYATILLTGQSYSAALFFENHLLMTAGTAIIFSIAMYCSNLFNQSQKGFLITGLIALILSVPGYFESTKDFSIFYHMQGIEIINGAGFPWIAFGVMILISGIFYKLGMQKFVSRDW